MEEHGRSATSLSCHFLAKPAGRMGARREASVLWAQEVFCIWWAKSLVLIGSCHWASSRWRGCSRCCSLQTSERWSTGHCWCEWSGWRGGRCSNSRGTCRLQRGWQQASASWWSSYSFCEGQSTAQWWRPRWRCAARVSWPLSCRQQRW